MAKRMVTARVPVDLADWVDEYAESRGVGKTEVLEAALKSLRDDSLRTVPDLPEPEPVPSPAQSGTGHWRDPSEEEIRGVLEANPELSRAQAERMARAQAFLKDRGVGESSHTRADVARIAQARVDAFAGLRTPESIKAPKGRKA